MPDLATKIPVCRDTKKVMGRAGQGEGDAQRARAALGADQYGQPAASHDDTADSSRINSRMPDWARPPQDARHPPPALRVLGRGDQLRLLREADRAPLRDKAIAITRSTPAPESVGR
jgi:hypothetical protein